MCGMCVVKRACLRACVQDMRVATVDLVCHTRGEDKLFGTLMYRWANPFDVRSIQIRDVLSKTHSK